MLTLVSLKECALSILTRMIVIVHSVFIIASEHIMQQSLFHVTYIARCRDFVDFQIQLFIKTHLFQLIYIDCNWTREYQIQDDDDDVVDFLYRDMLLSDSENIFDSSDKYENVKLVKDYASSSSLCFTQMRFLRRFCCRDVFLMYFVSKLHTISNDVFSYS